MRLPTLSTLALAATTLLSPITAEHTSNYAVLVSTSRFWFNYRHLSNVLSLYRTVKRLGIPDSQIILMLPDDMACNPRNAFPGSVFSNSSRVVDLYGDNIEVDYRGYEVTVEAFIRLLTDRLDESVPRSKRLGSGEGSNVLVYMTGHGGDEFLKFQDAEEISAFDLADAFEQMWEKRRYHELLFMIDTCQANTMYSKFYSPNIIATGSSELGQSSYSHHADNDVGVAVIDRYTYYNLDFLETQVTSTSSNKTLGNLFDSYDPKNIHSQPGIRYDLFHGGEEAARNRLIMDFFGNVQGVEVGVDELEGIRPSDTTEEEWREDLLSLGKKIEELQRRGEEQEKVEGEAEKGEKNEAPKTSPRVEDEMSTELPQSGRTPLGTRATKVSDDEHYWGKKIIGILVLSGLGLVWAAGSVLENV